MIENLIYNLSLMSAWFTVAFILFCVTCVLLVVVIEVAKSRLERPMNEITTQPTNEPETPMTSASSVESLKFVKATAEPVRIEASFLELFANGTFYVIGEPSEGHNCDSMGCNSVEHTIAKGRLIDWQVEEILGLPYGFLSGNHEAEEAV
jgi:hypothetical protein